MRWQSWNGHVEVPPLRTRLALPPGRCLATLPAVVSCLFLWTIAHSLLASWGSCVLSLMHRLLGRAALVWLSRVTKLNLPEQELRNEKALRPHFDDEDTLCSKVLFLGVVSRGEPRSNHDKETGRVALALERLRVLGSLRLNTEVLGRYANMFGLSVVSYGWVARLPTRGVSNKLWAAVRRA